AVHLTTCTPYQNTLRAPGIASMRRAYGKGVAPLWLPMVMRVLAASPSEGAPTAASASHAAVVIARVTIRYAAWPRLARRLFVARAARVRRNRIRVMPHQSVSCVLGLRQRRDGHFQWPERLSGHDSCQAQCLMAAAGGCAGRTASCGRLARTPFARMGTTGERRPFQPRPAARTADRPRPAR